MRSARATVSRRCAMMMAVRPLSRRVMAAVSRASVAGSRRLLGSSRMMTLGSRSMTRANASSCASPAERLPVGSGVRTPCSSRESHRPRPTSCRAASTCSSVTVGSKKLRLSRTLAWNSCTSCVTTATRRRRSFRGVWVMFTPPSVISPAVASYRREIRRVRVVLPLPVRPSRPTVCPAGRWKVTPLSTPRASGSSGAYVNDTSRKSSAGGPSLRGAFPPVTAVRSASSSDTRPMLAPAFWRS